jgi:hypothetical protein
MALGKFLAKKKTSVLYCSWLRNEFVDLYVGTVVGYNGPCTWDSVVQTGMKKEDFVQLYTPTPKYVVITIFRISGVARFFFCREERVIKMAAPNRSHEVKKKIVSMCGISFYLTRWFKVDELRRSQFFNLNIHLPRIWSSNAPASLALQLP